MAGIRLGLLLAALAQTAAAQIRAPEKLPVETLPEIAFIGINDRDVESGDVSELKRLVETLAARGTFNYLTVTCRCRHDDTEPGVKAIVRQLAEAVHANGLKMSFDLDPRHNRNEFLRLHPEAAQQLAMVALGEPAGVRIVCPGFQDHMSSNGPYAPVKCELVAAWAATCGEGGEVASRRALGGAKLAYDAKAQTATVSCEGLAAGERLLAQVLFTLRSCDVFSPQLLPFMDALIGEYAKLGIDGVLRDEWGFPPSFDGAFAEHRAYWHSAPLAAAYRRATGRDLLADAPMMAFPCADPARYGCIDAYMKLIFERNAEIERAFYDLHKRLFGRDSLVCKHPTWYPEIGYQELNHNGLDWWAAKRDWAQVDEVTYPCAALGMAKKFGSANWLCEGYQNAAAKYAPMVWRYALAGGRMVYHPVYPALEPYRSMPGGLGRVRRFTDVLDAGALRAQESVRLVNRISSAPPDSPAAVVFGHSRIANWADSAYLKWGFELTRDLWKDGWLPDLYPSTEFAAGTFRVDADGYLAVGAQRYLAAALVNLSEADRAALKRLVGDRKLKTVLFDDPAGARPVAAALAAAGAVRQPPPVASEGGPNWKTLLPAPDGTVTLGDGTAVRVKASAPGWEGDLIEGELEVGGRKVRYAAKGLFAARMGADGELEAVAGAGLRFVEGPGLVRMFTQPEDFVWSRPRPSR